MRRNATRSLRRLLLLVLVVGSAGAATNVFASVLATDRLSYLDVAILGMFFLSFAWISSAFWTALAGFLALCRGGGAGLQAPRGEYSVTSRTASFSVDTIHSALCDRAASPIRRRSSTL